MFLQLKDVMLGEKLRQAARAELNNLFAMVLEEYQEMGRLR
jgi:hypothetical protein